MTVLGLGLIALTGCGDDQSTSASTATPSTVSQNFAGLCPAATAARNGNKARATEHFDHGPLHIDVNSREVCLDGHGVELTRKEFDLLLALAHRPGEVMTKRELLAEVWRQAYGGSDRTVDVHLSWLRRKLGETAAAPRYLHSVRGVGVRLVDPGDG